ncbi:TPA: RHS repeat protein [Burkholderia cenocepacia]|nr:RHS repeat domain-containing protein [Burkholderia cenocepacia]MBR8097514.1 RHS repeat protein [Burkholderia cenocepacia]MDI9689993.1 RHS repeat protein [Burkholderia cenocepacia]HEP6432075.1 RHS repeat protein [Burkholderia cenocepacia]
MARIDEPFFERGALDVQQILSRTDRLTQCSTPFGNLAAKLRGTNRTPRFTYDGQDRLIAVRSQDARGVVETRFAYDPLGRCIAKSDTFFDIRGVEQRSETKRFVWEGTRLVQEVRETGVSSYVYSPDKSCRRS